MKELTYATTNAAKVVSMQETLRGIVKVRGLGAGEKVAVEEGPDILENATRKARAYYDRLQRPVFAHDCSLWFEDVPESDQPGAAIRRSVGPNVTDDQLLAAYIDIVKRHGRITARFKNALVCFIDGDTFFTINEPSNESDPFYLVDVPYGGSAMEGYPLDRISVDPKTGRYLIEAGIRECDMQMAKAYRRLFTEISKTMR
jgi:hypothetical protein